MPDAGDHVDAEATAQLLAGFERALKQCMELCTSVSDGSDIKSKYAVLNKYRVELATKGIEI